MITPLSGVASVSGALLVTLALVVHGSLATEYQRERSLRLPNETYPLFYQLHISSDIHKGTLLFSGNATIDVAYLVKFVVEHMIYRKYLYNKSAGWADTDLSTYTPPLINKFFVH